MISIYLYCTKKYQYLSILLLTNINIYLYFYSKILVFIYTFTMIRTIDTCIMCISITKCPEIIVFLFLSGIFSLDFKREFRRCCCCLQAKARQEEVATRILRQHSVHQNTTSSAICKPAKNHRGKKDYEHICMKERDNVSSGREESFISKNYL